MNKETEKEFADFCDSRETSFYEHHEAVKSFIDTHFISKKDLEEEIDKLLDNCKKALDAGAGSEFGSASGGIQLNGCKKALQDLKDKLLK